MNSRDDSEERTPPNDGKPQLRIEMGSIAGGPQPENSGYICGEIDDYLNELEEKASSQIVSYLDEVTASRQRTECDAAFTPLWWGIIEPYSRMGLGHRAATFARDKLIPAILELESKRQLEFHKGGLFYNTALVHLWISDHNRFEYFLAMADEEDYQTHGVERKPQERGTHNLKKGELSEQTIVGGVRFACELLNGNISGSKLDYEFLFGSAISEERFDAWRRKLDGLHHSEFFRFLLDAEVFLGREMPEYAAVQDNPYVLLRLVKVLSHAAQWCESRLALLQRRLTGNPHERSTIPKKLKADSDFSTLLNANGGDPEKVIGHGPHGVDVDIQLSALLREIGQQATVVDKEWRLLRLLYIVRNSTAHQIDGSLAFHTNRDYLINLIQAVLLAYFVIEKRKSGNAP